MAEKIVGYFCNKSFMSYELKGIKLMRNQVRGVTETEKKIIESNGRMKELIQQGAIYFSETVPDEFKTTAQQLTESNVKVTELATELDATKKEALDEIAKRDKIIEELKAELAKAKAE